jgi:tetratricopeptide (TPR) repeat protein
LVGGRGLVALALLVLGAAAYARFAASDPEAVTARSVLRTTSRDGLNETVQAMQVRLRSNPGDGTAAALLAEALLRQTRVANDPGLAVHAEQALRRALADEPLDYAARRMLGAVLLSQHRFREAIQEAARAKEQRPDDAWNDGVIGDGHLELGEYDEAFAAFDRMITARPDAASYARVSYARELQGDLDGAIRLMSMALEATSAADPEALAWHETQLGHLQLASKHLARAAWHFDRAEFLFPGYSPAAEGRVRVLIAAGDEDAAAARAKESFALQATPVLATFIGDLAEQQQEHGEAERYYRMVEEWLRREPIALSRFLSDRDRDPARALALAQAGATVSNDIFTADALALALFKAGRHAEAAAAIQKALRTGTKDQQILAHAAAIDAALEQSTGGGGDHGHPPPAAPQLLHSPHASVARQLH